MTRQTYLPEYLKTPVWEDMVDAIDTTLSNLGIDDARRQLTLLRTPINTSDIVFTEQREAGKLVRIEDIEQLERDSLVKRCNQMGFSFQIGNLLNASDYLRIAMHVGEYYLRNKGTQSWQDFLGFCANAQFQVKVLWTRDYATFFEEGEPGIGFPVWDGGEWYPTTHVALEFDASKFGIDPESVVALFYYFANINLVLGYLTLTFNGRLDLKVSANGYIEIEY